MKLFFQTFLDKVNGYKVIYQNIHEVDNLLFFVLSFLCIFSIFCGYFLNEFFTGIGNSFFLNSIYWKNDFNIYFENELLPWYIKNLPMLGTFFFFFSYLVFSFYSRIFSFFSVIKFYCKIKFFLIYKFFNKKWYFDFLMLDRGLLEFYGPTGLIFFFSNLSKKLIKLHSMNIYNYYFYIFYYFLYLVYNSSFDYYSYYVFGHYVHSYVKITII
jgi:NADH-ubiquinone oxidoreductase chain 5